MSEVVVHVVSQITNVVEEWTLVLNLQNAEIDSSD